MEIQLDFVLIPLINKKNLLISIIFIRSARILNKGSINLELFKGVIWF